MYGRARRAAPTKGRRQLVRFGRGMSSASQGFALRFPSNVAGDDTAAPLVALQFDDPANNGYPFWGVSNGGVTICWKVRPRQQTGYYAWFWYSRADGSFDGICYGMHPYPQNQSNSGTTHWWEIAVNSGDFIDADGASPGSGSPTTVTQSTTYTQGFTATRANANSKTLRYYFNLPNVTSANYVQRVEDAAGFGESGPGNTPKITIGDSPWYAGFQHERGSHDLDAIKIFTTALSEADLLSESADFTRIVTAAGAAAIWWGKNGFDSVDDLTCDFGTGRTFVWADLSNKGTLVARL